MNAAAKLTGFAVLLALLFGGAALAGDAIDPDRAGTGTGGGEHAMSAPAQPVRGLAVAEDGLRLVLSNTQLEVGRTRQLRFRIVDDHGATVRDFDTAHARRMHLIIVRRDLTGFQHLHPQQDAAGAWQTAVRIGEPGSYRLFADFTRHGEAHTLAGDLAVDGAADLRALPRPALTATSDGGDTVRLTTGHVRAGAETQLRFAITRGGRPVAVERYLGAGGHLVALREGDLAFLHVHPDGEDTRFEATFPTPGRYRLFLQFQHAGRVHTVAFTQAVQR